MKTEQKVKGREGTAATSDLHDVDCLDCAVGRPHPVGRHGERLPR